MEHEHTLGYVVYVWDTHRHASPAHTRWLCWAECEIHAQAVWQAHLAHLAGYAQTMINQEHIYV